MGLVPMNLGAMGRAVPDGPGSKVHDHGDTRIAVASGHRRAQGVGSALGQVTGIVGLFGLGDRIDDLLDRRRVLGVEPAPPERPTMTRPGSSSSV